MQPLILIVGGDRNTRAILGAILSDEGYAVSHVATAAEALQALRESPPSLLLLNTLQPIPEWTAFVGQVRMEAPALGVIVVTAYQTPEIITPLLELGVRCVIPKPFKTQILLQAVCDAIGMGRT